MTGTPARTRAAALTALALSTVFAIAACGGGDGAAGTSPPPPPPPPPVAGGPTWTAGVFQAASLFKNQCAVPRTGRDIEGNTFPDEPGSLLEENHWLRSWTRETYLWNTEVPDLNPAGFSSRTDYFAVLKTTAVTSSNRPKDISHFSQPTAEFLAERNSTARASYGVSYVAIATAPPRDFRVSYTEPNSPASALVLGQPKLARGTRILRVDGVDLVTATTQAQIDILNNGLFPATVGETHTLVVQDHGSSTTREIQLQSASLAPNPVNRTRVIDTPTGRVGYILFNTFNTFSAEEEIATAMADMKAQGVNDLVLDLRYNGGGLLAIASQVSTMIAGRTRTTGRVFERLQFNSLAGNGNPVTGGANEPTPFYDAGLGFSLPSGTTISTLDLPRVFILTTGGTCSASESVINGLRGINVQVVVIGTRTCGKPYGFYPTDNCGETYFSIQFRGVNDQNFGDYPDGFVPTNSSSPLGVKVPGCAVADDFSRELGDSSEAMLAAALQYRTNGSCPAPGTAEAPPEDNRLSVASVDGVATTDLSPLAQFLASNRDMRMPY